jgi:hypothetical protein
MDKLIHSSWTKGGLDNVDNRLASVDVGNDLSSSGGLLGSLLHDNDLWLLYNIQILAHNFFTKDFIVSTDMKQGINLIE